MKWLWWAAPLVFIFYLLVVSLWPTTEEKRFRREITRWLEELLGPLRIGKGKKAVAKTRRVRQLPPPFEAMVREAGGGSRVTDAVLIPKLAYAAVRVADALTGSNHVTIVCRLAQQAPRLVCRPLPEVDGKPVENRGVRFAKDPLFMETYLVESQQAAPTVKWLRRALRAALLERRDVWLRTQGDLMTLTLYGHPDAEDVDQLLDIADAICDEHGASEASLFGDAPSSAPLPPELGPLEPASPALRIQAGVVDFGLFGLGVFFLALTLGTFESFHPPTLFQSPDLHPTEPWQGGWTTKGFGAFVASEAFLVGGLFLQLYLASRRGATLGKLLVGLRVVASGGERLGFGRVCLRNLGLVLVPLAVAIITAERPLSVRGVLLAIPTLPVALALAAIVIVGVALIYQGKPLHDQIAKSQVVRVAPWRFDHVQLGLAEGALDPVVMGRILRIGGSMVAFGLLVAVAHATDLWPF